MSDLDTLLEEKLSGLFRGIPLEGVVSDLSGDTRELIPLLSLAAQTRSLQHPQMDPLATIRLRSQVMAAAAASHSQSLERGATPWQPRAFWAAWRRNCLPMTAAAISAIFLFIIIVVGMAVTGPFNSHYAVVADISGSVQLAAANGGGANQNISNGSHIQQGQRLQTTAGSSATLIFFDGSRMVVGPSSDITLTTVKGGWGNVLMVTVDQVAGSTSNTVVPFGSPAAYYNVNTPSGQASVHGTIFDVDVASNGNAYFSVDRGRIQVVNAISSVLVPAGQSSAALPKQKPGAPAYSFALNGSLVSIAEDMWSVSNLTFKVTPQTILPAQYEVGDTISVKGHIGSESTLIADWIRLSKNPHTMTSFSGMVETISSAMWEITGQPVLVKAETVLGDGIKVNDPVNVSFIILPDGRWQAISIQRLITDSESMPSARPSPTSSETPSPQDTLSPVPSESPAPSGTPSPQPESSPTVPVNQITTTPPGNRSGCGSSAQQQPEGAKLAQNYNVPYQEIMGWFCQGYGFGEIDQAYSLSLNSGYTPADLFAMRASGMGWGQIKQLLDAKKATKAPRPTNDNHPTKNPKPTREPRPEKTKKK